MIKGVYVYRLINQPCCHGVDLKLVQFTLVNIDYPWVETRVKVCIPYASALIFSFAKE